MTLWTSDDSDALDREVRESRKRERAERTGPRSPWGLTADDRKRLDEAVARYVGELPAIGPMGGRPRLRTRARPAEQPGSADAPEPAAPPSEPLTPKPKRTVSPERSETYKANRSKRPGRVRWPQPRPLRNGRWLAVVNLHGRRYQKTHDTPEQAEAWLDQMIKENP
ncbi:hypothetical protein [Nocardioides mangrovi]|uniref:Lsr2 family protein n=1 Tax=Nocardioides mangrovi TaxID=2874580 RepID=A0ABS7UGM0_9ACTN|nr:hypothetical protein [Nocardioides mangrovi]MBZ5739768.1 hypothetical protein [Nocardioides mangrovi]